VSKVREMPHCEKTLYKEEKIMKLLLVAALMAASLSATAGEAKAGECKLIQYHKRTVQLWF